MRNGTLKVKKVRHYRAAKYPSRHHEAKRVESLGRRVVRVAAVPAAALGLGAVGGACDGGLSLVGDPDAADAADVAADTLEDTIVTEDVGSDLADAIHTPEDAAPDIDDTDSMIAGGRPEGIHYVRYLSEAEGRAIVEEEILAMPADPPGPCTTLSLADRIVSDMPFDEVGPPPVAVDVDVLAPANSIEEEPGCPGGYLPAVGVEFATVEAGDDEDDSGDPAGLTDVEEAGLAELRERGDAAIAVIRSADHPYDVWDYDGYIEDYDRARAEADVRQAVRDLLDGLRRDGFI